MPKSSWLSPTTVTNSPQRTQPHMIKWRRSVHQLLLSTVFLDAETLTGSNTFVSLQLLFISVLFWAWASFPSTTIPKMILYDQMSTRLSGKCLPCGTQHLLSFPSLDCHSCATFSVMNLPHSQAPGSIPCWLWAPTSLHQREPLEPRASKGFSHAHQKMKPRGNTGACWACLRFLKRKLCLSMNLREKKLTQKTNSLDDTKLITVQCPFPMVCSVGPEEGAPETGNQETAKCCVTYSRSQTTAQG